MRKPRIAFTAAATVIAGTALAVLSGQQSIRPDRPTDVTVYIDPPESTYDMNGRTTAGDFVVTLNNIAPIAVTGTLRDTNDQFVVVDGPGRRRAFIPRERVRLIVTTE